MSELTVTVTSRFTLPKEGEIFPYRKSYPPSYGTTDKEKVLAKLSTENTQKKKNVKIGIRYFCFKGDLF
ncbi:MAG: hypothetical protein C4540_05960 [Candidatus Omnitrophota bacterium]|nr:MAG: hypothetical protein C4540_05960 [Candidatus Omnitrophota bacterium]